jgi:amino acid adenylation domain-containing protein
LRELLRRVRETTLGAYQRQDLPFEKLVEELSPERDLSHTPLFQVALVLQNAPQTSLRVAGLDFSRFGVDHRTSKYDLTLSLTEGREELSGTAEYATDLYERASIERLIERLRLALGAMIADLEQEAGQVALLTEAERQQVLEEWNETAIPDGEKQLVHELIAEQARQRGEAIAVKSDQGELSYRELNRRANHLANYLMRKEIGREDVVGICGDRSAEMVVAMLGALKAGAAYVPVDGSYPEERVRYMLENTGVKVLLTQGAAGRRLKKENLVAEVIGLESVFEEITEESADNPDVKVEGDNLAYVIYTSGSTGRPKGVMIMHSNLANSTQARNHYYSEAVSGFLSVSPFSFDSSVAGLYWTLCQGGTLILPPERSERDPAQLASLVMEHRASHLLCLPTLYSLLLTEIEPRQTGSLKCVIVAGEACPPDVIERHSETLEGVDLFNEYGPTEGTVWSSVYGGCVKLFRVPTPIGKPVANVQMYILDQELKPAPVGVRGEIYISGAGLARGYVGSPALTGEKFVPSRFSRRGGERLYRTGDVGRYLSDGNIEFVGRTDEQVKIRGYRIELGEIEARLAEHPLVREAVVAQRGVGEAGKRLVAYYTGGEAGAEALRAHLSLALPEYMIPAAYVYLESLPLTPNGKLDRRALPAPHPISPDRVLAPRESTELYLFHIWSDVLRREDFGVRDNFFDLGGHSLAAVTLSSRVSELYEKKMPMRTVFEYPTIELMARYLRREIAFVPPSAVVPIQPRGTRRPFFSVHPRSGLVHYYIPLARHLDQDQPFYGLQSYGMDQEQSPTGSVEEMASKYVADLRRMQPDGPYQIGGWSLGGLVAYEMAQQMYAAGEEVSLLALFDTIVPSVDASESPLTEEELREPKPEHLIQWLLLYGLPFDKEEVMSMPVRDFGQLYMNRFGVKGNLNTYFQLFRTEVANAMAARHYNPQPYPGRIALFRGNKPGKRDYGWGELAPSKVEVYCFDASHEKFFDDPNIPALAAQLSICLAGANHAEEPGCDHPQAAGT